ncbi:MAG: arabinose isomerase, partial [Bacteroides ovatus]|nr:arabinose isomerase [Bacteroides ovatus]
METTKSTVKVGLIGVGLNTYWEQFEGLLPRLLGYQKEIKEKMHRLHADVVDTGMVDTPQKAIDATTLMQNNGIEIAFIFISTYALSSTILPIAQRIKVPIVLLNVQPVSAIDYQLINSMNDRGKMTGEWLAHCQACSAPEFACVFNRAGIHYDIVTGYLQEDIVWKEIEAWIDAARVIKGMRENRMGILGHYYCGMLDVYTDTTMQSTI